MSPEKKNSDKGFKKKPVKVIRALFESEEHRRAEQEYEEYYNRIRNLSRGM